jgi:hypothetical protein
MPSNTLDQSGILFINGDNADTGDVISSNISFPGGPQPIAATFTCLLAYTDKIAYFRLFVQKGTAFTLRYEISNSNGDEGSNKRTVEFQQAKIVDYAESYDAGHQNPISGINDFTVSFSITALTATMGEAKFPGGS